MPEITYEITVSGEELSLIMGALRRWRAEVGPGIAAGIDALMARLAGDHPKLEPESEIERARRLR